MPRLNGLELYSRWVLLTRPLNSLKGTFAFERDVLNSVLS